MIGSEDFDQVAGIDWDVIVIGAGPAGATSACLLASRGFKVLLVERKRFPRDKVCGCCLSGRAIRTLSELGLEDVLSGSIPLETFVLGTNNRQLRLPVSGGVTLSRSLLDQRLMQRAVAAGACFLSEVIATIEEIDGEQRIVNLKRNGQRLAVRCKIVLACGGLGQRVSAETDSEDVDQHSKLGFAAILPEAEGFETHTISMASGKAGYVGIVVLEDGRLNLAAALTPEAIQKNSDTSAVVEQLIKGAGFTVPLQIRSAEWTGTPLLTRRRKRLATERVLILGDAAGYVEPFTGEGMAWAFAGAQAALPIIVSALQAWDATLPREWESVYRGSITRHQLSIQLMKRVLQYPRIIASAIPLINSIPWLVSPIVKSIHGHQPRRDQNQ